jgi:hypothetical protein
VASDEAVRMSAIAAERILAIKDRPSHPSIDRSIDNEGALSSEPMTRRGIVAFVMAMDGS